MLDILARQVASPVQFVKGLRTLYDEGARVFVEVGPKRALQGFASDVLGDDGVLSLATNHPKPGDIVSFNNALCGLWAAGLGAGIEPKAAALRCRPADRAAARHRRPASRGGPGPRGAGAGLRRGDVQRPRTPVRRVPRARARADGRARRGARRRPTEPVVITGAALGLPGAERLFDDANVARLLDGEQGIDVIPGRLRREMLDKHVTRLVKGDDGGASLRDDRPARRRDQAGGARRRVRPRTRSSASTPSAWPRSGATRSWRSPPASTRCATPASRSSCTTRPRRRARSCPTAGRCPTSCATTRASSSPRPSPAWRRWPTRSTRYTVDHMRRERLAALESLRARMLDHDGHRRASCSPRSSGASTTCDRQLEQEPYTFDRRFLFRVLSMGHSQLAELIGARGPNTQINSACASTTQAVALAEDWIRAGRCRRVRDRGRRRRDLGHACSAGSARASWPPAPRPPTRWSRTPRCRSTGAATG